MPQASSRQSPSDRVPGFPQSDVGLALLERYHRELLNFLTRQVNDRDAAADLAQESYVRVLSAQSSGLAVLDVRALLYRIARNLVIDQHRRAEVRRHENLDAIPDDQHPQAPQHMQPKRCWLPSRSSART